MSRHFRHRTPRPAIRIFFQFPLNVTASLLLSYVLRVVIPEEVKIFGTPIALMIAILVPAFISHWYGEKIWMSFHRWARSRPTEEVVAYRLTAYAAAIAGRRRAHLREEWNAHLSGAPEDGIAVSSADRLSYAFGFMRAALRMRQRDLARPLWRPVDWLLRVSSRTNGFIASIVGTQAVYIVGNDGLPALVTEVWEPCGIAGAALFALSRWLRRVRGIELAQTERSTFDE
jgi:hypothetical protein